MNQPNNLMDCVEELKKIVKPEDLEVFKNDPIDKAVNLSHFGMGMWLRNNWGLWEKGPLYTYFKTLFGLDHPDDMSDLILRCLHKNLNNQTLDLKKQIDYYIAYWNVPNVIRIRPEGT